MRAALARFRGKQDDVTEVLGHVDALNRRAALLLGEVPEVQQIIGRHLPPNEIVGADVLAALVPKPRAHLTRYHGVFAPASPDRARIVPKSRPIGATGRSEASAAARQRALSWAQRLKRVFAIEIETCRRYGGRLRVIASIEAPAVIARILEHLGRDAESVDPAHPSRAPPERDLWI